MCRFLMGPVHVSITTRLGTTQNVSVSEGREQGEIHSRAWWRFKDREGGEFRSDEITLSWIETSGEVVAGLPLTVDEIAKLNGDASMRKFLARALSVHYRFKGPSRFDCEIRF